MDDKKLDEIVSELVENKEFREKIVEAVVTEQFAEQVAEQVTSDEFVEQIVDQVTSEEFTEQVADQVTSDEFVEQVVEQVTSEDETPFIPTEKITPKGDLTWYMKWFGVVCGVIGTAIMTTVTVLTQYVNPVALFYLIPFLLATLSWFFVGMLWKDRALMITNAINGFSCLLACLKIGYEVWVI